MFELKKRYSFPEKYLPLGMQEASRSARKTDLPFVADAPVMRTKV
jgi:hypothetical protein